MKEILDKFPSVAHVARNLGVGYKRASKWRERDSLPAVFDTELVALAQRDGIDLSLQDLAEARAKRAPLRHVTHTEAAE